MVTSRRSQGRNFQFPDAGLIEKTANFERFKELYCLLGRGVAHECGDTLNCLIPFGRAPKDKIQKLALSAAESYVGLTCLSRLLSGFEAKPGFSRSDLALIGLKRSGGLYRAKNLDGIKTVGLRLASSFSESIDALDAASKHASMSDDGAIKISKLVTFGNLFSAELKRLFSGSMDVFEERIPMSASKALEKFSDPIPFKFRKTDDYDGTKMVIAHPAVIFLIGKNLYSNAERSAQEKGIKPEIIIQVSVENSKLAIRLTDNGNGMTPEVIAKLNAGEQVTTKKPGKSGEHGIGFQYCRELAQKMGGNLHIERSDGTGTTVVLELKLAA